MLGKLELIELINQNLSTRKIANIFNCSQYTVKYWLKKYNLKTNYKHYEQNLSNVKICSKCNINKNLEDFYKNGKSKHSYCKKCVIENTINRQRIFKRECIEYKGSKCKICSYNNCDGVLEFHHLDPSKKDFQIARARLTTFNDKIKKELDKCVLLCANCHREIHMRYKNIEDYI